MRYLLETSFLVSLLCGERAAASAIRRLEGQGVAMAAISLGELYLGALMSSRTKRNREAVDRLRGRLTVLPLDAETCQILGSEAARLAAGDVALPMTELVLAATCLRHGLTLVTADPRQYEQVSGLTVLVPRD
jgi:predicted nucleic acid-binding protein